LVTPPTVELKRARFTTQSAFSGADGASVGNDDELPHTTLCLGCGDICTSISRDTCQPEPVAERQRSGDAATIRGRLDGCHEHLVSVGGSTDLIGVRLKRWLYHRSSLRLIQILRKTLNELRSLEKDHLNHRRTPTATSDRHPH
jgi:hypothetical protein